jgi:RNA polymerase sigma factor (TIGR02999 family)
VAVIGRPPASVTQLLQQWRSGDTRALDQLTPLVYAELRRLATGYLRREQPHHTLQPTELVHEAFVRLIRQDTPDYQNRAHFMAIAAIHMRQILVDHARRRRRVKRGGDTILVPLEKACLVASDAPVGLLELDRALAELEALDPRKTRAIEMHFFGGMRFEDIALVLGIHVNTVARDMRLSRAWLRARLSI